MNTLRRRYTSAAAYEAEKPQSPVLGVKLERAAAGSLAIVALICLLISVADQFQFDGLICLGLNPDVGAIKRGAEFQRNVSIINLTVHTVRVTFVPGCGCEEVRVQRFVLRPFSHRTIPVRFLMSRQLRGHVMRQFRLIYQYHGVTKIREGHVRVQLT